MHLYKCTQCDGQIFVADSIWETPGQVFPTHIWSHYEDNNCDDPCPVIPTEFGDAKIIKFGENTMAGCTLGELDGSWEWFKFVDGKWEPTNMPDWVAELDKHNGTH